MASNYERLGVSADGGLFDDDEDDDGAGDENVNDQIHVSIMIYFNVMQCFLRQFLCNICFSKKI